MLEPCISQPQLKPASERRGLISMGCLVRCAKGWYNFSFFPSTLIAFRVKMIVYYRVLL